MIDLSSIYRNTCIPAGYYWAKAIDIDTEEIGLDRPRIEVKLKIGPMHASKAIPRSAPTLFPSWTPAALSDFRQS